MEAVLMHASAEKPIPPYKSHIRNQKQINRPLISRPCDQNFLPLNLYGAGVLQVPPPFLYHSYPPFSLQLPPPRQQPPLLPLPTTDPLRNPTTLSRHLSCPPRVNRRAKNNPKKSPKSTTTSLKKEKKNSGKIGSGFVTAPSNSPLGPDPKDLPKNVAKVSSSLSSGNSINTNSVGSLKGVEIEQIDKFSGSVVFTISPPPSSLPLPTFSLRPKLSCHAEASGIDTGATDNLRRILRLP